MKRFKSQGIPELSAFETRSDVLEDVRSAGWRPTDLCNILKRFSYGKVTRTIMGKIAHFGDFLPSETKDSIVSALWFVVQSIIVHEKVPTLTCELTSRIAVRGK